MNKQFEKTIQQVYAEIDKFSDLYWAAKDVYEIANGGRKRRLRHDIKTDEKDYSATW